VSRIYPLADARWLPCGCFGWTLGPTHGAVLCGFHVGAHDAADWKGGCDCIRCRAAKRGLSPYRYAEELLDQAVAARRGDDPKKALDAVPMAAAPEVLREKGRKCSCGWLCARGEWRVEAPCRRHVKEPTKDRREREHRRNEHGWA